MIDSERPSSPADTFADQLLHAYDSYAETTGARRLASINEQRGPDRTFVFGYLRTSPQSSRATHDAYVDELDHATARSSAPNASPAIN